LTFFPAPENPPDPALLEFFKENFGFVPNVFRAQTLRPEILEREAKVMEAFLTKPGALSRKQKEAILIAVSAANRNTYYVTVHSQILQILGVSAEQSNQIAIDHRETELPEPDKALLDFAIRLARYPTAFASEDIDALRCHAFTDEQILEAVLIIGLTEFLNTVQMGVGAVPDFEPSHIFSLEEMNPSRDSQRPMIETPLAEDLLPADEDAEIITRVQSGDTDAFAIIVRRHTRRMYRSLLAILGNPSEAEDALQEAFLKAFQHIGDFEGRSRFSTWVLRITINTGIQHLRSRKEIDSLEEEDNDFRPRNIQAWQDDPEQSYSKEEMRRLVEKEIMRLPAKYRIVLMLRDIEELSTAEAANALGLGIPALKARLLRGRFMLRESLSPYFTKQTGTGTNA